MRTGTLLQRYELYAAAAAIAAHASRPESGFRQRDVSFLIQLFSNWLEQTPGTSRLKLNNTQVFRYLDELAKEGFAKVSRRGKQPEYQLTRAGLLELVTRIVNRREENLPDQFFFVCYFIQSYKPKIVEIVERQGKLFPPALRLELETLLDVKALREHELKRVDLQIAKLEGRLADCKQSAQLARRLGAEGRSEREIVAKIQEKHPYELNSQKPLSELFAFIPPDYVRWELETGYLYRANVLWQPSLQLLKSYRDVIRRMGEPAA